MTSKQKETIEQIIRDIISITLDYANEGIQEASFSKIHNIYKNAKCNITKSYYAEINNLIDQQISNILGTKEKRQQIQEYIVDISKKIASMSSDNNFKNLINHIGSYVDIHIRTYSSMLNSLEETTEAQKKYNEQISKAKKNLNDSQKQLAETKDTIDNLLPNLLTVLSILISIVIAVVIVYITVFLDNDNKYVYVIQEFIQARFAQYVLCIHVVGDLCFLMMFMIARLTNRSILMTCSHFDWDPKIPDKYKDSYITGFHRFACADCCADCSFIKKLQRKSAYIIYFNVLMVALYIFFYIWWIFDYYIMGEELFLFRADFWFLISIGIIALLIFLFRVGKNKIINKIQNKFVNNLNFAKSICCYDYDISMFQNKICFKTINNIKRTYDCNKNNKMEYKSYNNEFNLLIQTNKEKQQIEYTWIKENKSYIFLYNLSSLDC